VHLEYFAAIRRHALYLP
ncbi:unnamed protein product, partial [Allacma fusca]